MVWLSVLIFLLSTAYSISSHPYVRLLYKYIIFRFHDIRNNIRKKMHVSLKHYSVVEKFDNYMTITYYDQDDDKMRKVFLPLRMDNVLAVNECKVEAFICNRSDNGSNSSDHKVVTIVQDPEIPILVTASNLGAEYILVHNNFNGEEKHFKGEEPVECFTAD